MKIVPLFKRAWDIYINPPKESLSFISPNLVPVCTVRTNTVQTKAQPKQVAVHQNHAYVSCMAGHSLEVFDIENNLQKIHEISFEDQCVEVNTFGNLIFATTTNFSRIGRKRNKLWIIEAKNGQIISNVDTHGNWSKVITIHPSGKYALVSNWQSNDISVISIEKHSNPSVIQILKPESNMGILESPRGIAFTKDGSTGLITGFYSRNILEVKLSTNKPFQFSYISKNDQLNNSGNPRDIVILPDSPIAYYSNLGTNSIVEWSIPEHRIIRIQKVGKEPNSISLGKDLLYVSCRSSKSIYLLSLPSLSIIGRSEQTGETPTGLKAITNGFLVTDFDSNKLELHRLQKPLSTE